MGRGAYLARTQGGYERPESGGSQRNNQTGQSGGSNREWANEFAGTPTTSVDTRTFKDVTDRDRDYGGTDYVPWQETKEEVFQSAFGGLDYSWVDPDSDFFTDKYGNKIGEPGKGLWNPFVSGYNEEGDPIYLTPGQFNDMYTFGEFGSPYGRVTSGGGGGGGGWGGYGGYGGGGGGYGWGLQQDPMQRGYQREIVGPGTLQEQVNQLYLGMGTPQQSNPQRFSRGGIVSLLRLN